MRTRCEKKKQKDATRRQEELTTEQLAEKQANADACAQVSILVLSASAQRGEDAHVDGSLWFLVWPVIGTCVLGHILTCCVMRC